MRNNRQVLRAGRRLTGNRKVPGTKRSFERSGLSKHSKS